MGVYPQGTPDDCDRCFRSPSGAFITADGTLYVADTGNHRIQKFDADGAFLTEWGERGSGDLQFRRPRAVAVSNDGRIYVADDNNARFLLFDASE